MNLVASLAFALVCCIPLAAQTEIVQPTTLAAHPTRHDHFQIIPPPRELFPQVSTAKRDMELCFAPKQNPPDAKPHLTLASLLLPEPNFRLPHTVAPPLASDLRADDPDDAVEPPDKPNDRKGFRWGSALRQSLLFLAVQHSYALTQPKTRRDLKGEFFGDYFASIKSLGGWEDGGRFFTNYVAHPMQGSFVGFIQIQNDPKGMRQRFGRSGDYWKSRMKAMAWSAVWSTQFEIGPISQASIGNVGLHGKQTYVDLVVTPTVGTAMLITEDALDRYVVQAFERRFDNFYVRTGARLLLNPTRSVANLIRFKKPWHRDRPRAH